MFKRVVVVALASLLATSALAENFPSAGARQQSGGQAKLLATCVQPQMKACTRFLWSGWINLYESQIACRSAVENGRRWCLLPVRQSGNAPILKRDAQGLHGTLFYGWAHRREHYPSTKREVDWNEQAIDDAQRRLFRTNR